MPTAMSKRFLRGKNRWRELENTWNGQRRVLAQVTSTGRPEATTLQPNLLFLVGCDRLADGRWYRMLRFDGKPVLKGWSPSAEMQQTADGATDTFAGCGEGGQTCRGWVFVSGDRFAE
jgi:hypothetical protein